MAIRKNIIRTDDHETGDYYDNHDCHAAMMDKMLMIILMMHYAGHRDEPGGRDEVLPGGVHPADRRGCGQV